jgi:hypothetical protein
VIEDEDARALQDVVDVAGAATPRKKQGVAFLQGIELGTMASLR